MSSKSTKQVPSLVRESTSVEMVLVGPYANPLLGKTYQFINSVNFFLVIAFNVWIHTVEMIPPSKMRKQEDEKNKNKNKQKLEGPTDDKCFHGPSRLYFRILSRTS